MAKLKLKETAESNLEVGDLIISEKYGERLIISLNGRTYYGVDVESMEICGTFYSIEEAISTYCYGDYRIIKAKNLTLMEE